MKTAKNHDVFRFEFHKYIIMGYRMIEPRCEEVGNMEFELEEID